MFVDDAVGWKSAFLFCFVCFLFYFALLCLFFFSLSSFFLLLFFCISLFVSHVSISIFNSQFQSLLHVLLYQYCEKLHNFTRFLSLYVILEFLYWIRQGRVHPCSKKSLFITKYIDSQLWRKTTNIYPC